MILHYLIDSQSRKAVLPEKITFKTLLAYIDLPQFSTIEADYISKSNEGYEHVAKFYNRYLDAFQATIGKTGAEILKFVNHKLIVGWPPLNNRTEDEISLCCKVALKAAFDFRQAVQDLTSIEGIQSLINISFGFGDVSLLHTGGIENKVEYFVLGSAFLEALDCENAMIKDNNTAVCTSVCERIKDMFVCEEIVTYSLKESRNGMSKEQGFFYVTAFKGGRLPTPKNSPLMFKNGLSPTLIEGLSLKIANYVPKEYVKFAQESIENWGCEYRQVTVAQINLMIDPSTLTSETPVTTFNQYVRKIQSIANLYQGIIHQTTLDQRGFTATLIFGLYPQAQQEAAVAGVLSALSVWTELSNYLQGKVCCGLSTGDVYLGFVGQEQRTIFVFGEPVHRSNILMLAASREKDAKILLDEATKKEAERKIAFTPYLGKGLQGRIAQEQIFIAAAKDGNVDYLADSINELRTHMHNSDSSENRWTEKGAQMIGKQELLQRNKEIILDYLGKPSNCGLSLIAGAMGSGKTLFARNLYLSLSQAIRQKQGNLPLILCSSIEARTQNLKLNGWRKVLKDLLSRLSQEYQLSSEETLKKLVTPQQELLTNIAIVNDVLDLSNDISNSQLVQPSKEEQRIVVEICFEIIKAYLETPQSDSPLDNRLVLQYKTGNNHTTTASSRPPLVLFLDDLQDYDELSWSLFSKVAKSLKRVYIVGLFRVDELEFLPSKKAQLLQQGIIDLTNDQPNLAKIVIDPLTNKEVAQLIADTLATSECDLETADIIHHRTKGNPLLIIQLLSCLKREIVNERGVVALTEKMKRVLSYGESFADIPIPSLCHKLYNPNLDQMPLEQYLLLKLASSFGERFDLKTLIIVNPFKGNLLTHSKVVNALEAIKEAGLITIHEQKEDKNIIYKFVFPFLNDLLFQKMPYSLKRNLKRQISETTNFTDQHDSKLSSRIEESGKSMSRWKLEEGGSQHQDQKEEVVENVKTKLSGLSGGKDIVLKADMLEKKAIRTPKKWIPRYFTLGQRTLRWYLNEEQMNNDPIGVIQLEHIYKVRVSKQEDSQKPYGIVLDVGNWRKRNQVHYGRSLFLACKDVNEAENWYIWIEAIRTRLIFEEFWSNFEDKAKIFNQLSTKPLSQAGKNPFDQTISGLYHSKNFKRAGTPEKFERTASPYKGRETFSTNFSSTGAGNYSTNQTNQKIADPFAVEDDPADLARDRTPTADFGVQAQIASQPEKNALMQEAQGSHLSRLNEALERSKVLGSNNVSISSQKNEVQRTYKSREASPAAEKPITKESSANYLSQKRQTKVKSTPRLLLEEFLNKTQTTFWSHLMTAPSKPQLTRIHHLNGLDESPRPRSRSRSRSVSPNNEFDKIQDTTHAEANSPVSILRKRSTSRDRENAITRRRSTSRDVDPSSTGRKRSMSRDPEEHIERVYKLPNRVYQSDWEVPQSRRDNVFNDDAISNLAGTARNSRFFDQSEADHSVYQDLQNMSFTDQSNMSFTKEFGEAPEEREVIRKTKNSSRIYTENITIYTQKPQKNSRGTEEEDRGPSKPNIYGKYEMFTSFFVDSYFDKCLVPSKNNGVAKVQPRKNRKLKQKYPNIMRANKIRGDPYTFEVSEVMTDRNRPIVYATLGGKRLEEEDFSYRSPIKESPLHTLPQQERPIERRAMPNVERVAQQRVPEHIESHAERYLNNEYHQPSLQESMISRSNYIGTQSDFI